MDTFNFITDTLARPEYLIGGFTFLGLVLQRKAFSEVISGTIKAVMGFLILGIGATIIIGALSIFSDLFRAAFQMEGVMPTNEAVVAIATKKFATETAFTMLFGMLFNILFARYTPLKYIFLTGHHTFFMAVLLVATLSVAGLPTFFLILLSSLILGLCMVVFPAILQPFTRKIIGSDDMALGHFNSLGYFVAAIVGKYTGGNPDNSTEKLSIPKGLSFLRDTSVAISLTMFILFGVLLAVLGLEPAHTVSKIAQTESIISFVVLESLKFAAGLFVILSGVRLLISEIVPAFRGIADKIVPNAKPALDCPMVFPYAPNAVIVGFICSFAGGVVSIFLLSHLSLVIIIPGIIPHFFTGATAGVYGNATGGKRGAILGSFANGMMISFIPAFLYPLMGVLGYVGTTFGDSDFGAMGILLGTIIRSI